MVGALVDVGDRVAATGAASALFAWREQVAQDEWNTLRAQDGQHDYSQLVSVASRGQTYAIATDVGLGLASAAAIAAITLAITGRDAPHVTLTATRDDVAIGVAGRF